MSERFPLWLIPNAISLARLLALPVIIYLILERQHQSAFWLFAAAGISDAVDGVLAKRLGVVSEIGAYLDALADKALLVGVYVTLGYVGHVAIWLVFLIVFRDFLIIAGAILFQTLTQSLKMEPLFVSKVNTTMQITLATVVLAELGLNIPLSLVSLVLVYIVAATTFVSGAAYVVKWTALASRMDHGR